MLNTILSNQPVSPGRGLAILRIMTGLLMAYHGLEVFDRQLMAGYAGWDMIKVLPAPMVLVYLGKGTELVAGLLLTFGVFTRLATLAIVADMLFICFYIGHGRFYYQDQHPFLFAMLALVFFFAGPGKLKG